MTAYIFYFLLNHYPMVGLSSYIWKNLSDMAATDVKRSLHELIDSITDEALLVRYLELLQSANRKEGAFWSSLTDDERKDILKAYEESKDPSMLTVNDEVKSKYRKWL